MRARFICSPWGDCGSCVGPTWTVLCIPADRQERGTVNSVRHPPLHFSHPQILLAGRMTPDPFCKPRWCWPLLPSLGAPCPGKRCSWQRAEAPPQTPQRPKHITHRVRKHRENPFISEQFMFWKLQFPSKCSFASDISILPISFITRKGGKPVKLM